MAVEHETGAAARPRHPADAVEAVGLDFLELDLETELGEIVAHEAGDGAFLAARGVAADAHHLLEQRDELTSVDGGGRGLSLLLCVHLRPEHRQKEPPGQVGLG